MTVDFSSESDNDPQTPSKPHQVRRPTRERKPPDYFWREQTDLTLAPEPTFFKEAISSLDQSGEKQ